VDPSHHLIKSTGIKTPNSSTVMRGWGWNWTGQGWGIWDQKRQGGRASRTKRIARIWEGGTEEGILRDLKFSVISSKCKVSS
jgi:hypothetical protein